MADKNTPVQARVKTIDNGYTLELYAYERDYDGVSTFFFSSLAEVGDYLATKLCVPLDLPKVRAANCGEPASALKQIGV